MSGLSDCQCCASAAKRLQHFTAGRHILYGQSVCRAAHLMPSRSDIVVDVSKTCKGVLAEAGNEMFPAGGPSIWGYSVIYSDLDRGVGCATSRSWRPKRLGRGAGG